MLHLIQLLKHLRAQGYGHAELKDLFTNYFPEQGYELDDILEFFEVDISETKYIEQALPKVESALVAIEYL